MTVTILSLFDGMACGYIAFKELGIPIGKYYAYEIDKYAVQTSSHNFPDIVHNGASLKNPVLVKQRQAV